MPKPRHERSRWSSEVVAALLGGALLCGLAQFSAQAAEPESESESAGAPVAQERQPSNERAASNATSDSFEKLLSGFAAMPGFEARFVEEKTLALLALPLRSEGRIYFAPPSSLLREVTYPSPQRVLVRANEVRLSGGGREEVIDLRARTEIRPMVESLLWLFAGNHVALTGAFEIEFSQRQRQEQAQQQQRGADSEIAEGWTLQLVPKGAPLSHLLERLTVRGSGLAANEIAVEEVSGDRSVMRIFDADPERQFTSAELKLLFRRGPGPSPLRPGSDD